jgi:hypothetical protein
MKQLGCLLAMVVASGVAHADIRSASEVRLPEFHSIELAGGLDVEITVGPTASVAISGDPDVVDKVTTVVNGSTLVIDTKARWHLHTRNPLVAHVTVPELRSVTLNGSGRMTVSGVASPSFAIDLAGSGSLTVAGSTGSLRATLDGSGSVEATRLTVKDAAIALGGSGNVSLSASQSVDAKLTGHGNIRVLGHPARVERSVSGSGNIQVE